MEQTRFPPLSARQKGEAMQKQGTKLEELAGKIVDAMPNLGHEEQRVAVAHGARWTATHKGTFLLSLEEAFTLGQMTNARKFQGAL